MTKLITSEEYHNALQIVKAYKQQFSYPIAYEEKYFISEEFMSVNLKEAGMNRRCINKITEVMLSEKIIQEEYEIITIAHLLKLPLHVFKSYRGVGAIMIYEIETVLNTYHKLTMLT